MMDKSVGMTRIRLLSFIQNHLCSYRENEMEYFTNQRLPVRIRLTLKTLFYILQWF